MKRKDNGKETSTVGISGEGLLIASAVGLTTSRFFCVLCHCVTTQDIGTTLWSFATSGFLDKAVYRRIASRLKTEYSSQFKSQELSNTLWALATAEVAPCYLDVFDTTLLNNESRPNPLVIEDDPVTVCFAIAAQELMRRPFEFKPQEIKDILWSFSKVGGASKEQYHTSAFQS